MSDGAVSLLTDGDLYLFNEGSHLRLYDKLGAHPDTVDGLHGTHFSVWAPNAARVTLIGPFNNWDREATPLQPRGSSGIWERFIPGIGKGEIYKFHVASRFGGYAVDKSDPFALFAEVAPKTASVVWDLEYDWKDQDWMARRAPRNALDAPMSVYEVHLGSWMRVASEGYRSLSYREMADRLTDHVAQMGFTHVEIMPIMEHPFFGSWGYQVTGYFAPTSRYGTPQDLMFLIDQFHQRGIGVILDWVPSHFPTDQAGLGYFDGTHLFEHSDPRKGHHKDWDSYIFNYGRHEVRSFLLSSAMIWLERYHADGLRVDAVASMLHLDYSRAQGEWVPNEYGGRENLEAMHFLQRLNAEVYRHYPDVQMIAEESTSWPMVSRPIYVGGLGFGMKWDMGWMHDTLRYMSRDPVFRKYHHTELSFRMLYAYNENFMLPLSHDEVVHLKGSLVGKMPGDAWQKFANLRTLFGYMYGMPGKKLLFMGSEIGQWREWAHDSSLDWHLLDHESHRGLKQWLTDLNHLYRNEPALFEQDFSPDGFEWIDANDALHSTASFFRRDRSGQPRVLVVLNFTPVPRHAYRLGVPQPGYWTEVLNSDAPVYWGSGMGNLGGRYSDDVPAHGRPWSLSLTLPPLSALFFRLESPGTA